MKNEHPEYPQLELPAEVLREKVIVWNNGLALDADLYKPKSAVEQRQRVPAVVLSHGLGGSKQTAERYAAAFALNGMVALTFTHAGWFASDSRPVLAERVSVDRGAVELTQASARFAHQVVDPLEWVQNFRCAVDFIMGEDHVDVERIGAWGTSYGGGIALFSTCFDNRIKALAMQVGAVAGLRPSMLQHARQRATDMARGLVPSVPTEEMDSFPAVPGVPHYAKMLQYRPIDHVARLNVPTLIVDAESEEMFDIRENGGAVRDHLQAGGTVPFQYRVIPNINHYGIYFDGFEEGKGLAVDWFVRHLCD